MLRANFEYYKTSFLNVLLWMLCKNLSNGVITRTTSVKAVHTQAVQAVQAVFAFFKKTT